MTIWNLFGRSPFAPLQSHMEKVSHCVHLLPELFVSLDSQDEKKMEEISNRISENEHNADLVKNDIRNHLPKSLFLPIDRGNLLDILSLQDSIADCCQDISVIATLKKLQILDSFKDDFIEFLNVNIEAFDGARKIIHEIHELLESSFGGSEAKKVRSLVDDVGYKEHQADLVQRRLLKKLLAAEGEMSYTTFFLWQKIFELVAKIANLSENLAMRVRTTLEIK